MFNKYGMPLYHFILYLVILSAIKIVIVLTTFDRGFDLIDEGSHLLFYSNPQTYNLTFHNYHYYVSLLPENLIQIPYLRFIWWILDNSSFAILTAGVFQFLRIAEDQKRIRWIFILFIYSGISLSVHDRMLGYNIIVQFCIHSSFGLLLLYMTYGNKSYLLLATLVLSPVFFIKISSFVLFITLEIVLLILLNHSRSVLKLLLFVLISILFNVFFLISKNPTWLNDFSEGLQLANISGYGSKEMLIYLYVKPAIFFCAALLISFLPALYIRRISNTRRDFVSYLLSLTVLIILYRTFAGSSRYYIETYSLQDEQFYHPIIFIYHYIFYRIIFDSGKFSYSSKNLFLSREAIICISLFLVPLLISFGSFSDVFTSLYAYTVPYLLIIIIIWSKKEKNFRISKSAILLIPFFLLLLFVQVYVIFPARLLQPLYKQTEVIPGSTKIKVDKELFLFVEELQIRQSFIKEGTQVCYIGNYAGVIYLLNRKQPGTTLFLSFPYFGEIDEMNVAFNQYFFSKYRKALENSALFIDAGVNVRNLKDNGKGVLDFGAHVMIDSVYNPYLNREKVINKLIAKPYTYIYIPK